MGALLDEDRCSDAVVALDEAVLVAADRMHPAVDETRRLARNVQAAVAAWDAKVVVPVSPMNGPPLQIEEGVPGNPR